MVQSRKLPLSAYRAMNCELATGPRCDCRCGGKLHGVRRAGLGYSPAAYYLLPEADPHHVDAPERGYQFGLDDLPAIIAGGQLCPVVADARPVVPLPDVDV